MTGENQANEEQQEVAVAADFAFDDWAREAGLSRKAIAVLRQEDLVGKKQLSLVTAGDIRSLNLQLGQAKLLQAAIDTLTAGTKDVPPAPAPTATVATASSLQSTPADGQQQDQATNIRLPDIRRQAAELARHGESLDQLFSDEVTPVTQSLQPSPVPTAAYDPRAMLTVKATSVKVVHITQFLPERTRKRRAANRRQLRVVKSPDDEDNAAPTLMVEEQEEHPYSGIAMEEWGAANARLMHHLLKTGILPPSQVDYYLAYTAKVFDLADNHSWESVLDFDHSYRERQAEHQYLWGTLSADLEWHLLTPKRRGPASTAQNYSSNNHRKPAKTVATADCKLFKARGTCPFGDRCKYRHTRPSDTQQKSDGQDKTSKN